MVYFGLPNSARARSRSRQFTSSPPSAFPCLSSPSRGGVDRGEEKAELWFLVVLHSLENLLIILASRLVYMQESYPRLFLIVDSVLVLVNILAVLVTVLYVTKLELYAGLPRDLPPSLPSYGSEVSFKCESNSSFHLYIYPDISGCPPWQRFLRSWKQLWQRGKSP